MTTASVVILYNVMILPIFYNLKYLPTTKILNYTPFRSAVKSNIFYNLILYYNLTK